MNTLLIFLAKQSIPTIVRHALVALAGFLMSKGIPTETSDFVSIFAGLAVFAIAWMWSVFTHTEYDASGMEVFRTGIAALLRNGQTALVTWIVAHGVTSDTATAEGIIIAAINVLLSIVSSPAAKNEAEAIK